MTTQATSYKASNLNKSLTQTNDKGAINIYNENACR